MIYVYHCSKCALETDVYKSVDEIDREELCPGDGTLMQRILSPTNINTSNCRFESNYNPAFGKVMHSKRDIKNEIRRLNGEQGRNIEEVGNDSLKSIKKQRKPYTID